LSGKHGIIDDTAEEKNFQRSYLDLYLSTNPVDPSFFGNRSVVVHALNGTRLNCANFTQQWPANNGSGGYGSEGSNPLNGAGGTGNDSHNGSGTPANAAKGGAEGMIKTMNAELSLSLVFALAYAFVRL